MIDSIAIAARFDALSPFLDERERRLFGLTTPVRRAPTRQPLSTNPNGDRVQEAQLSDAAALARCRSDDVAISTPLQAAWQHRGAPPVRLSVHSGQRLRHLPRPVQFPLRHRAVAVGCALQQRQGRRGMRLHQLQLALRECHRQPRVLGFAARCAAEQRRYRRTWRATLPASNAAWDRTARWEIGPFPAVSGHLHCW